MYTKGKSACYQEITLQAFIKSVINLLFQTFGQPDWPNP